MSKTFDLDYYKANNLILLSLCIVIKVIKIYIFEKIYFIYN